MSWADTEKAIQAAIVAASELPDGRVVWEYSNEDAPPFDYIGIDLSSSSSPALDGIVYSYDVSRPAGKEIKKQIVGYREVQLDLQIYTAALTASANAGQLNALALAERIRSKLSFASIRDEAAKAGVSFLDIDGTISWVPAIVATKFRGRALFPIRCNVPAEALVEYIGYIATVNGALIVHGGAVDPTNRTFTAPA